ncbi:MAG: hypothetical protein RMM17_00825 [Acidobacteriota bacterium]|nr:hypothetical protein [Blastocatellia bacterium]MDW8411211.1 hypothetical protein [Acidobacteriota bacterium]
MLLAILVLSSLIYDDPLLLTGRTFWQPIETHTKIHNSTRHTENIASSSIDISSKSSAIISAPINELLRVKATSGRLKSLTIFRLFDGGKLIPKEVEAHNEYLLITPPRWINRPTYLLQSDAELKLICEYLVREDLPFYTDTIETQAQKAITKWQDRSCNIWQKLEPGDKWRSFYRRQLITLPRPASTDYEINYLKAKLRLDLLKTKQTALTPLSTTDRDSLVLDGKNYFPIRHTREFIIEGPKLVEITSRLVYTKTPPHEVLNYALELFIDERFVNKLFLTTRLDDACGLVLDQSQRPLAKPCREYLFIPPGKHKLQIASNEDIYCAISTAEFRRYLREKNNDLATLFVKAKDQAEAHLATYPNDHNARFVAAAASVELGLGKDVQSQLSNLFATTSGLTKIAVALLLSRVLCEQQLFEEALQVLNFELPFALSPQETAFAIELALQRAFLLRVLNNHKDAVKLLQNASALDPRDTELALLYASASLWMPNEDLINPVFIATLDRALEMAPSNIELRSLRQLAWDGFTYWQETRPEMNSSQISLATLDFIPLPQQQEALRCPQLLLSVDYVNDPFFYQVPVGKSFKIDLRNPFEQPETPHKLAFRVSHRHDLLFEIKIHVDGSLVTQPLIYKSVQYIELSLSRTIHELKISSEMPISVFLDHPPLNDVIAKDIEIPLLKYARRSYLSLRQPIGFLTRDDELLSYARILFKTNEPAEVELLIDGSIAEKFFLDCSTYDSISAENLSTAHEVIVPIPAARHRILLRSIDNAQALVNFSIRTTRRTLSEETE